MRSWKHRQGQEGGEAGRASGRHARGVAILLAGLLAICAGCATAPGGPAEREAAAVDSVDASSWGFDAEDSTEALQAAIDSGAARVVVPFMGVPWIVRPITLRSNQEITFAPGVLVLAKEGAFKGKGDSLFTATDEANITLRGYGAVLRMRKKDYQSDAYEKAEWRMALALRGCKEIRVEGLRLESSGGDGIYLGATGNLPYCEDVVIRDVVCDDNHRQGLSVIGAVNLLVENCAFSNTSGTGPAAGIDLEPNHAAEKLVNCVIRNCVMENNEGHGILVYLKNLSRETEPVSVLFENCLCRGGKSAGMVVGAVKDDGPQGMVEFRNCTAEDTGKEGAKIYDKSADNVHVRFANCNWSNAWAGESKPEEGHAPVFINLRRPELTQSHGGVEFVDCTVHDGRDRAVVLVKSKDPAIGGRDLFGVITVHSPHEPWMELGAEASNIHLEVRKPVARE